jgi:hypothetical protein
MISQPRLAPLGDPTSTRCWKRRVHQAREAWEEEAGEAIAAQVDDEEIARLQERYDDAREEIERIAYRLGVMAEAITLPDPPAVPEPDMAGKEARLIDSDWGFVEGTSGSRRTSPMRPTRIRMATAE